MNLFSFPLGYERLLPLAPGKPSVVLNLHEVSDSCESKPYILFTLRKGIHILGFHHRLGLLLNFIFHKHNIENRGIFLFSNFDVMPLEDNSDWIDCSKIRLMRSKAE